MPFRPVSLLCHQKEKEAQQRFIRGHLALCKCPAMAETEHPAFQADHWAPLCPQCCGQACPGDSVLTEGLLPAPQPERRGPPRPGGLLITQSHFLSGVHQLETGASLPPPPG